MIGTPIYDADGKVIGIACSRGPKKQDCSVCTQRAGSILCDGPAPAGERRKTCDAPLCRDCAHRVGPNRDLCPTHYRERANR